MAGTVRQDGGLTQKAVTSAFWTGGDAFLRLSLKLGISIALARLLSPGEFGVVAILYVFTEIANRFVDSGFSAALIQSQNATHPDESTVFWFNVASGAVVALALMAGASLVAGFFSLPVLRPLTFVMALSIFISAVGAIHNTLLTKALQFRTQMKVSVLSTILSGSFAIVLAWRGYGVWALAMQTLVSTVTTTILLWCLSNWRPGFEFSRNAMRGLFGFGGYLLVSSLIDSVYRRAYALLIGRFYGVSELGLYNRAYDTQQMPASTLSDIVTRIAFPVFSAAAHDKGQLRRGLRLAVSMVMLVNVSMMLGLAVVAEPLVLTVFGRQWLPAVPVLKVLCIAGLLWPLHVINLNVLMALGHSDLFLRLEVVKKAIGIGLLLAGSLYGLMGIAWTQVGYSIVVLAINTHYTRRFLNYGVAAQCRDFLPVLAVALAAAAGVHWLYGRLPSLSPAAMLICLVAAGVLTFLGLAWVSGLHALRNAVELLRRKQEAVELT